MVEAAGLVQGLIVDLEKGREELLGLLVENDFDLLRIPVFVFDRFDNRDREILNQIFLNFALDKKRPYIIL